MTFEAGTVVLNNGIIYEGLCDCLIDNGEKVASSKIMPNRKPRVQKPNPIYGQNCQNRYPI